MIAKLSKGSGFGGLVNYANDIKNKQTNIIASDGVSLKNNKTITASFKAQSLSNPNVKKFVGHIALSFSPEDVTRMDDFLVREIALQYMHRMGIRNTQYVIFRHHDQPHDHVHIVYNRVDNEAEEIKTDSNFKKSIAITRMLTREYNLTFGKGKDKVRRERLRGKDAAKYRIYDTLKAALESAQSWKQLETILNKEKITFRLTYRSDGLVNGISFSDGKYSFAGSKIDRAMTYWKINKVLVSNREQLESVPATTSTQGVQQTSHKDAHEDVYKPADNVDTNAIIQSVESVAGSVNNAVANVTEGIFDIVLQPEVAPVVSSGGGGSSSMDDDDDDKNKDKDKDKKRPQKITHTPTRKYRGR